MAKKKPATTDPTPAPPQSLGDFLAFTRRIKKFTLRDIEEATEKEVSNAYLSQLETGKITKPSPNILHALARVYGVPYELLMEKAGYIAPATGSVPRSPGMRHGRTATFADDNLTQEEEESLLEYLAFLRSRRGKSGEKEG